MSSPLRKPLKPTIYIGNFIHTPSLGKLEVLEETVICVDANGIIVNIYNKDRDLGDIRPRPKENDNDPQEWHARIIEMVTKDGGLDVKDPDLVDGRMDGSQWWVPGFVGECFSRKISFVSVYDALVLVFLSFLSLSGFDSFLRCFFLIFPVHYFDISRTTSKGVPGACLWTTKVGSCACRLCVCFTFVYGYSLRSHPTSIHASRSSQGKGTPKI